MDNEPGKLFIVKITAETVPEKRQTQARWVEDNLQELLNRLAVVVPEDTGVGPYWKIESLIVVGGVSDTLPAPIASAGRDALDALDADSATESTSGWRLP